MQAKSFYNQLTQPVFAPPSWVFGPVWSVLYTMMGVAAWLVWRSGGFKQNQISLLLFFAQLAFNSIWSWLFFAWSLGLIAFVEILFLWILILSTLVTFWRTHTMAGLLLIPYLLWVSFAAFLNYFLWKLNPKILG